MNNRYILLLADDTTPNEIFVRRALGLLEADLREMALLSLQEWTSLGIVSEDLFKPIAMLMHPAWGTWNNLLIELRKLRSQRLQTADASVREKIQQKTTLKNILNHLHKPVDLDEIESWLMPLYRELTPQKIPRDFSFQQLLTAPIALRNHIAHGNPTNTAYWDTLAAQFRPFILWLSQQSAHIELCQSAPHHTPWFVDSGEGLLTYNGIHNKSVNYVSDDGALSKDKEALTQVSQVFQSLMGKTDLQYKQFRELLGKLAPEEEKGVFLGDFLLSKPVGSGAHGIVHKGIHLSTGRPVAIKLLKDHLAGNKEIQTRFKQEAELLSRFNSPHIVKILGYADATWQSSDKISLKGEDWYEDFKQGDPQKTFIAMEWIEGQTLDDVYLQQKDAKQAPDLAQLTQWFVDACTAIEQVHQLDYIHRDIKPSNLMIDEAGTLKLMDFGIARALQSNNPQITQDLRDMLGTPAYMAPEQIRVLDTEAEVGKGADIYGLSAVFYELYTQKRLFGHHKETVQTIKALKKEGMRRPLSPTEYNKKIPWALDIILKGGLENEVTDRYNSVSQLKRDLLHYQANEPIEHVPPSLLRRITLGYRRNRRVVQVVAVASLVVAVLSAVSFYRVTKERNTAEAATILAEQRAETERLAKERAKESEELAKIAKVETEEQLVETNHNFGLLLKEKSEKAQDTKNYNAALVFGKHSLSKMKLESDEAKKMLGDISTLSSTSIILSTPDGAHFSEYRNSGGLSSIVSFNPIKNAVSVIKESGDIIAWNLLTGEKEEAINSKKGVVSFSYHPKGSYLATVEKNELDTFQDEVYIWDMESKKIISKIKNEDGNDLSYVVYNPTGEYITTISDSMNYGGDEKYVNNSTYNIEVWDSRSGDNIFNLSSKSGYRLKISYNKDNVLATQLENGIIELWNILEKKKLVEIENKIGYIQSISFSSDGDTLVYSSLENVTIFNIKNKKEIKEFKNEFKVLKVFFSPANENELAILDEDKITLWSLSKSGILNKIREINGSFNDANFSSDGKILAAISSSDQIRLWQANSGQELNKISGHSQRISTVDFNSDGSLIATKSSDGTIKIWDGITGKLSKTIRPSISAEMNFSPTDRNLLVTSSNLSGVDLWNLKSGKLINIKEKDPGSNIDITFFSGDGERLIIGENFGDEIRVTSWNINKKNEDWVKIIKVDGYRVDGHRVIHYNKYSQELSVLYRDKAIRTWEAASGSLTGEIRSNGSNYHNAAYSVTGDFASISENEVEVWGRKGLAPKLILSGSSSDITAIEYSPNGKIIASASRSGEVRQWDALTGDLLLSTTVFNDEITDISYSPNGKKIAVSSEKGILRVIDSSSVRSLARGEKSYPMGFSINYSRDGGRIAYIENILDSINIVDSISKKLIKSIEVEDEILAICFSPNGKSIAYLSSSDNLVKILDIEKGKIIPGDLPEWIFKNNGGFDSVWGCSTGKLIETIATILETSFGPFSFDINKNGSLYAFSTADSPLGIYNVKTNEELYTFPDEYSTNLVRFRVDGKQIAAATDNGVNLWSIEEENKLHFNIEDLFDVTSISYSPDGKYLVTIESGDVIKIWDINKKRMIVSFSYERKIAKIAFSPSGKDFSTLSFGGLIKTWDFTSIVNKTHLSNNDWLKESKKDESLFSNTLDKVELKAQKIKEASLYRDFSTPINWPQNHIEHWLLKIEKEPANADYMYQIGLIYDRDNNRYHLKTADNDDNKKALIWYKKAIEAGSEKAKERLAFLEKWMENQKSLPKKEVPKQPPPQYQGEIDKYKGLIQVKNKTLEKQPNNIALQWDLSDLHLQVGDIYRKGDGTENALTHYKKAVEIRTKLTKRIPGSSKLQNGLKESLSKIDELEAYAE